MKLPYTLAEYNILNQFQNYTINIQLLIKWMMHFESMKFRKF